MPYTLTWERAGVLRRYHGDVGMAELRASFDAICGDPRFDRLRDCITDYLAVQGFEVTPQATREIAAFHLGPHRTNPRLRIAAVATRADVLAYIRDFMAQGLAPQPYRVFATLEAARRWIEDGASPRPAPTAPGSS